MYPIIPSIYEKWRLGETRLSICVWTNKICESNLFCESAYTRNLFVQRKKRLYSRRNPEFYIILFYFFYLEALIWTMKLFLFFLFALIYRELLYGLHNKKSLINLFKSLIHFNDTQVLKENVQIHRNWLAAVAEPHYFIYLFYLYRFL